MKQQERYEERRRNVWQYAMIDPDYYDSLENYKARDDLVRHVIPFLPKDWRIRQRGIWQQIIPRNRTQRMQGWKIHVSAHISNRESILKIVTRRCIEHEVFFKFSCDGWMHHLMNTRRWPRSGSGKFITIYPPSDDAFKQLIEHLYLELKDFEGPYILSDKRYKNCKVLYYRYGAMMGVDQIEYDGRRTPFIISPTGDMVPDLRMPFFNPPSWVQDPFPEEMDEDPDPILGSGRYVITQSITFSNSGGVYLAYDTETGQEVIIKEARPHTDCLPDGSDAFAHRKREWKRLKELQDTGLTPVPIELFQDWEHLYLVQTYFAGLIPLRQFPALRGPVSKIDPTSEDIEQYFLDVLLISKRLAEAVQVIHNHNIVIGDFSHNNVLIHPETLEIKLIDFEGAIKQGSNDTIALFTPGFVPSSRRKDRVPSFEDDYYALGALIFELLTPSISMSEFNSGFSEAYLREFERDFGMPRKLSQMILSLLSENSGNRPEPSIVISQLPEIRSALQPHASVASNCTPNSEIQEVLDGISRHIRATLTPDRQNQLVHSDYNVTNPLEVAHGALGAAMALKAIDGEVPPEMMAWIFNHPIHSEEYAPGLYNGLSGIAWSLADLGYIEESLEIIKTAQAHPLLFETSDMFYGLAGFGLTNLYFYNVTGKPHFLDWCIRVAEILNENKMETGDRRGYCWPPPEKNQILIGYHRGASGVAMFLLNLYLVTQEIKFLRLGRAALDFDLSFAVDISNGVSFPEDDSSTILFPYWANGSAGVGTTLLRYAIVTRDEDLMQLLEKVCSDAARKYTAVPGLFHGLAGLGNFLFDCYQFTGNQHYLDNVYRVISGMLLFKIDRSEGIAFPGDGLARLSTDFGSGSAGIGLFLDRVLNQKPNFIFTQDKLIHQVESLIPNCLPYTS